MTIKINVAAKPKDRVVYLYPFGNIAGTDHSIWKEYDKESNYLVGGFKITYKIDDDGVEHKFFEEL